MMKKSTLILVSILTVSSVFAEDFSLRDFVGRYQVTHEEMPVVNTVIIKENGSITLIEESIYGEVRCEGQASVEGTTVNSQVKCDNGVEYTQRINLENVENFEKFSAPVYSSLLEMELDMDFRKLRLL